MDASAMKQQFEAMAANADPINATIKFDLDGNKVHIDGTGDANVVSYEDKDADCVIITSAETLGKLQAGDLNPMMAVMTGKVKIKGDMGVAMKLQSLLG